jgi:mannan endo-1,4-beta-mannosidase
MYGYNEYNSKDIGGLLDRLRGDPNVTCLVYNWKTGIGYAKTGFNLSNEADYKTVSGYTTFILKNKIPEYYKLPVVPRPSNPVPVPGTLQTNKQFVSWNSLSGTFMCNGVKFVPVGFNAYWLGYTESYDYPVKVQVDEMFTVAKKISATTIRSHTLGHSSGSAKSLRPSNNTLNDDAWRAIDYAFYKAKQNNIKLICPLTDCYTWYNGSYGDFCKTRGVPKSAFWTDPNVRNDFKDYISQWLNHVNIYTGVSIKNSPELAWIELGNELGNIRHEAGSTTIPTQEWISDISTYIRTIDKVHLIMNGSDECLGSHISNDFAVTTVDTHSAHFYWNDTQRLISGYSGARNAGKGYIIGEYNSGFGEDWFRSVESMPNVHGTLVWSFYPHDNGLPTGNRVQHTDGFTLYYEPEGWDAQNNKQVLIIANHHRRMRNLPEISHF